MTTEPTLTKDASTVLRQLVIPQRNYLLGYPIPRGHLVMLDFVNDRVALYQHWRRVGDPAGYLREIYDAPTGTPPEPQGAA